LNTKPIFSKIALFITILSTCFSINSIAQTSFSDVNRAEYIISFSQNVTWENLAYENFTIGILDNDSLLYYMLYSEIEKKGMIHNKNVEVKLFTKTSDIKNTNVIFLEKKSGFSITGVQEQIKNTNTLLLTENFAFHKSMINFIIIDGKRNFEVNEEYLTNNNLKIHPLLLKHSVKTKEDWEGLYAETERKLLEEQEKNKKQTKIISVQTEDIKRKETEISELQQSIFAQKKELKTLNKSVLLKQNELSKTLEEIKKRSLDIEVQEALSAQLKTSIKEQQKVLNEQSNRIHSQDVTIVKQTDTIENQGTIITLFIIIFLLVVGLGSILIRQIRITKRINTKLAQKNDEVSLQRDKIIEQNKHITDSIVYAQRIQHAILPPQDIIAQNVPDHFILFKPRDIVSGDYYWMTQIDDIIIVTAADCTGHGVPGAFMSLLGITFLNEIVHEKGIIQPHEILNQLRIRIKESLNKEGNIEEYKDGMDMAICMIHKKTHELEYAGAYNSLYIIRDKELQEIKADKMPVGLSGRMDESFTLQKTKLQENDSFYMFSDGYPDQFGGPKDKKFMTKKFKELLIQVQDKKMDEQKEILNSTIENWKGEAEQVDDILVIGIKV